MDIFWSGWGAKWQFMDKTTNVMTKYATVFWSFLSSKSENYHSLKDQEEAEKQLCCKSWSNTELQSHCRLNAPSPTMWVPQCRLTWEQSRIKIFLISFALPISNIAIEKKSLETINIFSFSLFPVFAAGFPDRPQASGSTSGHCPDCCCLSGSCSRPQSNYGGVDSQGSQSHHQSWDRSHSRSHGC